ncbi:SH3 domain-containing protein [Novosphingobium sp. M1R2S20]|uniref:SH3 domain-containing protein n=1 Tax=Novosphingobium rhizovicinum TaxID=3228928 RepID=A0ABV3RDP5_9SPHN
MTRLSAPIFPFGDNRTLPLEDSYTRPDSEEALLTLSGPSVCADPGHLPVRGDLAHIKLAGRCFVPHYAVPMPHRFKAGALLRVQARNDAEVIAQLEEGTIFEVLDMAGAWAWGQVENDGLVGYTALDGLEPAA